MIKKFTLITILTLTTLLITPSDTQAAACDFPLSGNITVEADCSITAGSVMGVDDSDNDETSTANTAVLELDVNANITISSTAVGTTTLAVGSITLTDGSIIIGSSNAQIKLHQPIYFSDADADGWGVDFNYSIATAPGKRRRSLMKSISLTDCNDADPNTAGGNLVTYYQDLDDDTYGNSSVSETTCSPSAGYVENSTDCYDADPATTNAELAYPGSSSCLGSHRGDNSYDYNCSSSDTKCGVIYNHVCYTTPYGHYSCGGMAPDKYCKDQTINLYRSSSTYSCGQTGCIGTGSIVRRRNSCNSNGTTCSFGLGESGYVTVDTGPQTCQ